MKNVCTSRWFRSALLALLVPLVPFVPLAAGAQQRPTGDTLHHGHILPALGIRVGAPQKASAAVGIVAGEDWQQDGRDHSRNLALYAEPGLSAGRVSLAYVGHGFGSFGSGIGLGATVMRTWDDPWWARENVTYAGGELVLWPIFFIGPRVGVFRPVTGDPTLKRWLVTFDFGFGL